MSSGKTAVQKNVTCENLDWNELNLRDVLPDSEFSDKGRAVK